MPVNTGGRPELPEEERRKQWDIRLTAAEQAIITSAAKQAGLPPRVWARQVLIQTAGERIQLSQPSPKLRQVVNTPEAK